MPTITPVARAIIGGTPEDYRAPKITIDRATGSESRGPTETRPKLPPPATQTGQSDIKEETDPPAVTLSAQMTAMARKDQKLQQKIQEVRDREAALTAKEADFIPKSTFKAKLNENAAQALEDLGTNYEEIVQLLLKQQQSADPIQQLHTKINQLEKADEQRVSKQYEATVNQYKREIEDVISKDDQFITVREEKAQEYVLQHILDTFEQDNQILTVEEASKEIEDVLVEEALKKAALTKVKAKLAPAPDAPAEKKLPPPKSAPRTLTQSVETAPTRTVGQFQHLSPRERIAQAIARAQK